MTGSPYVLDDGEELHAAFPETFHLPPAEDRRALRPGALVKLVFRGADAEGNVRVERMWVRVTSAADGRYVGALDNSPYHIAGVGLGDEVAFGPEHVIQIDD